VKLKHCLHSELGPHLLSRASEPSRPRDRRCPVIEVIEVCMEKRIKLITGLGSIYREH
jgi:hypothetical protein